MIKKALALCGILVVCTGVSLGLYLLNLNQSAISKDFYPIPLTSGGPCTHPLAGVHVSERTMAESESQALIVYVKNPDAEECTATVAINAPNFDISPYENKQNITLPGSGNGSLSWILTPKKVGVFEVSIAAGFDGQVIGISVTNLIGLSSTQAQIISYFGSFLGPMLTAPWWYERWKERKTKDKKISKVKQKRRNY